MTERLMMHRLPRALALRQTPCIRLRWQPWLSRLHPQRTISQYIYKPDGTRTRFQAVKFKESGYSWKRTGGLLISWVGTYLVFKAGLTFALAVFTTGLDEDSEEDEDEDGAEDDEEEDDEDVMFIPLTWATKLPRTWYHGSDPEWQEFIKVSKDKERRKKIQNDLVTILYKYTCRPGMLKRQLGKDIEIGKYWLETRFPEGPPPEYQRGGIIIGDRYVAVGTQTITPEEHWRWMRIIWPEAAVQATFAAGSQLIQMNYRRIKQVLGIEEKDPKSPEERLRRYYQLLDQKDTGNGVDKARQPTTSAGEQGGVVNTSTVDSALSSLMSGEPDRKYPWYFFGWQSPSQGGVMDGHLAVNIFNATLHKHWNPKKQEPPRGSFIVHGMVEIKGEKARALFDVVAFYDPLDSKWLTINAGLRALNRKHQTPLGDSHRPPPPPPL